MSFGGSVAAMLSSLRHNKRERVSRFDKDKREKDVQGAYGKLEDHTQMDPYAFNQFKKKLEKEAKRESRQTIIALVVITLIVIATMAYLLY